MKVSVGPKKLARTLPALASMVLLAGLLAPQAALAESLTIFPSGPEDLRLAFDNPPANVSYRPLRILMSLGCYRTNLRTTAYPLTPTGCAFIGLGFNVGGATYSILTAVPATYFAQSAVPNNCQVSSPTLIDPNQPSNWVNAQPYGWQISAAPGWYNGNDIPGWVQIMTNMPTKTMSIAPNGDFSQSNNPVSVFNAYMFQDGDMNVADLLGIYAVLVNPAYFAGSHAGGGSNFGTTGWGPLSGYVNAAPNQNGNEIDVSVNVPGAAYPGQGGATGGKEWGFCGGFYSPLMLFFDGRRPRFTGQALFNLNGSPEWIYWPERGAPGYFLAYDKNGDGRINDGSELFGAASDANGFESLRRLDVNHDGVINEKDPAFRKLVLWDGVITKDGVKEKLIPLSSLGVTSISLHYDKGQEKMIGGRAALRETASFEFRDKAHGKHHKGQVVDVWFGSTGKDPFAGQP